MSDTPTDDFVAALSVALVQAGWVPRDRADLLRKDAHPAIRAALEAACEATTLRMSGMGAEYDEAVEAAYTALDKAVYDARGSATVAVDVVYPIIGRAARADRERLIEALEEIEQRYAEGERDPQALARIAAGALRP